MTLLQLPDDHDDLLVTTDDLIVRAVSEQNVYQVAWWIAEAFMQGVRQFEVLDYSTGKVEVSYEDPDGRLHLRWDEPLTKLQTEIGRLSKLDVSALCRKRTHSLESLRNASISQILMDNVAAGLSESELQKVQFITMLVLYGTCGIALWRDDLSASPIASWREIIPPWELMPVPANTSCPSQLRGIIRTQLYPYDELVADGRKRGYKVPSIDEGELELIYRSPGAGTGQSTAVPMSTVRDIYDRSATESADHGRDKPYVRLRQFWMFGPNNTVSRYLRRAGRVFLQDIDYVKKDKKVPFPIGIARYQDTGHFYGRSLASKIIPISLELEHLMEKLIQNMADLDRFGYIMVPLDMGVDFEAFKSTETPRVIGYNWEPGAPDLRPSTLNPSNTTDVPGKILQLGVQLLDRIVAQGPLFAGMAPGRTDSNVGFQTIAEQGATHLMPIASSIEHAYTTSYRSCLYDIRERFKQNPSLLENGLEVVRLENSIAGVTIDPSTGKMMIDPTALPDPWGVDITIRSKDPNSSDRRRQEAVQFMQMGKLPFGKFVVMNYRENWDYPIGNQEFYENYLKAVLYNLIMFNDGTTTGQLPDNAYANQMFDIPDAHLLAILEFTATSEFALSSKAVRNAFYTRMQQIKSMSVGAAQLPQQLPSMQMAAMNSMQEQSNGQSAEAGYQTAAR